MIYPSVRLDVGEVEEKDCGCSGFAPKIGFDPKIMKLTLKSGIFTILGAKPPLPWGFCPFLVGNGHRE